MLFSNRWPYFLLGNTWQNMDQGYTLQTVWEHFKHDWDNMLYLTYFTVEVNLKHISDRFP